MTTIKLSKTDKQEILNKLQKYMLDELDVELGQFDAEFLLDFFTDKIGNYFYNQGVYDSQRLLSDKLELISDAFYDLEQPVNN